MDRPLFHRAWQYVEKSVLNPALVKVVMAFAVISTLAFNTPRIDGALVPLSFEELTKQSKLIATGTVVRMRSYYAPFPNFGQMLYTDVTVRIDRVLKGDVRSREVTVQILGGRVGDRACVCPASGRYKIRERTLLFLREANGTLWNTGWHQGKYRISEDGLTVIGSRRQPIGRRTPLATVETQVRLFSPPANASAEPGNGLRTPERSESSR